MNVTLEGIVFKQMKLKPNILDEITRQLWIQKPPQKDSFVSDDDYYVIEDESGRVVLEGDLQELFTGMVVGLIGYETKEGKFNVKEIVYPTLSIPPAVQCDAWIAIVSGIQVRDDDLATSLLADYLTGEIFDETVQRVIVAGNSFQENQEVIEKNRFGSKVSIYNNQPLLELDDWLTAVASLIPVDLMPGTKDPCPQILPQQPIHKSMFKTCNYSSFTTTTNPYSFSLNQTDILVTSGQNIADMAHFTTLSPMDIAKQTLKSGIVCPTSPDTLWSFPTDLFCLDQLPHLYIIGNQAKFETCKLGDSMIIMVPDFSKTKEVVLVNLNGQVKTVCFDV
ncbi:DNA polymerase delta subunit 2 [Boothiomyces macroporosus]|uniref:DNA polymerase delta subunit 2 n=1 Tax=Boothiomyces macroporosus TaxID=261099 RepID=A0AAD5UDE8_9FUNG|nr:DNA polymerase delta subunit 2 [Boothiomyces macroporosus]